MDVMARAAAPAENKAMMAQEAFSDYHLYTLGRKTSECGRVISLSQQQLSCDFLA